MVGKLFLYLISIDYVMFLAEKTGLYCLSGLLEMM